MNPFIAGAVVCTISSASLAIVVVDPSQYIARPPNAIIGHLRNGTCVPIGDRYALTANHVGVKAGQPIDIDGQRYIISRVIRHPQAPSVDLKVLQIDGPPFFPRWMPVHPDPNSVPAGTPVYIGGFGVTTDGVQGDCVLWGARDERWAMNNLEGHIGQWSWYRFDTEVPNEGMAAVYDSGSPLIVADDSNCNLWIVGVASTATSGSTGPSCDGHTAQYTNVDPLWLLPYTGPRCDGDLDADGDTDVMDFSVLVTNFGDNPDRSACTNYQLGDLNEDGSLDLNDVSIMILNFGCGTD